MLPILCDIQRNMQASGSEGFPPRDVFAGDAFPDDPSRWLVGRRRRWGQGRYRVMLGIEQVVMGLRLADRLSGLAGSHHQRWGGMQLLLCGLEFALVCVAILGLYRCIVFCLFLQVERLDKEREKKKRKKKKYLYLDNTGVQSTVKKGLEVDNVELSEDFGRNRIKEPWRGLFETARNLRNKFAVGDAEVLQGFWLDSQERTPW